MTKRSAQRHRQERREHEGEKRLAAMEAKPKTLEYEVIGTFPPSALGYDPKRQRLGAEEVKALDAVSEIVERKIGQDESRQPRFTSPAGTFSSVYRWALTCMANEPSARAPFKVWDEWYRDFSRREPFLVGVLNSATSIDKNRGWTLTGGKNQVAKYTKRLHSFDNGAGWRSYVDWQAQSYYTTHMGFVSELGRDGRAGPLLTMWSVDPCRCELSGNPDKPLWYTPRSGGRQEWGPDMFVRGKSLVSTDEAKVDYGYPAIARCYDLAKIMVGIYSHYQQKVGTKTPDGILTGKFIGEEQWKTAVEARTEALNADPNAYLNSLATIMSSGGDMPEFALTLLSSIPDKWDFDQWTLVLMRGYALSFGYQSSEFYPEPAGVMGRGKEQEEQRRSATGKGGKDFALAYQEQMQQPGILPPTLEFAFEERDVTGEQADAQLQLAKAQVITEITKWAVNGQSILPAERIMELAAEQGVIPEDWTPTQEDVTQTDEESADTESESERVYRACQAFPDEPIVRYSWPSNKTRTLYRYGADRFAPKFIVRFNPYHEPAGSPEGGQFAEGEGASSAGNGDDEKIGKAKDFETAGDARDFGRSNNPPPNDPDEYDEYVGAINKFTDGGYKYINGELREGKSLNEMSPQSKRITKDMDKYMSPIGEDIIAHRAIESLPNVNPGDIVHDKGFISTTLFSPVLDDVTAFKNKPRVKIFVGKGKKGLYIGEEGAFKENEIEFVLPRGSKFKVVKIDRKNGTMDVVML